MKRTKYGFNCQWQSLSGVGAITPVGYMEVVPGDTVSGSTTLNSWTDTTPVPWMNKMYQDYFAFYVPYRVLWDDFPNFIRGAGDLSDNGIAPVNPPHGVQPTNMPTVDNTWFWNFEKGFSAEDPDGAPATVNTAF